MSAKLDDSRRRHSRRHADRVARRRRRPAARAIPRCSTSSRRSRRISHAARHRDGHVRRRASARGATSECSSASAAARSARSIAPGTADSIARWRSSCCSSESTDADSLGTSVIEEGRLLARIRHPNVVTIYGAERTDGFVGLWMELVKGRTLEQQLVDGVAFTPRGRHSHRRGPGERGGRRARRRPRSTATSRRRTS